MLGGYRAAGCRSHRASVATLSTCASPAIPNFAHVEARASGVFVHGRSPQARACRGTCKWRLRPWAEPSRIPPAPTSGRSPQTSRCCFDDIYKLQQCLRGHFVHVQLGSHLQPRASTRQGLVLCGQIPRTTRICNIPGAAAHRITFCSCSSAYVATLSTSSWTAQPGTHAPSIWISARFAGLRCEHAVCTMRLSFMRYTIGGEEPRAPRPVP